MALISTTTTDADGVPSGEFVGDSLTSVNLRASHTIMVRVKHGSTATNYHSVILAYIAQADLTGSYMGRDSGAAGTSLDWTRQAAWPYARDEATYSTCYGDTSTWYHIALVYDAGTGQKRAYIDGAFVAQQASSTTRTSSTTSVQFVVGAHNGKFADAALFNRALSDSEVADMAAYRVPQVTSGLVTFWRLDSDATDSSGNGNNGAESGGSPAVSWSTADNPPQPETPSFPIAASASASTSGSAAVQRVLALGACTGSTSTSGTASAGVSLAATATAGGRGIGWADVMPRNGAEGYRFPVQTAINVGSVSGAASGGVTYRTFMCWARLYVDTTVPGTGLTQAQIIFRGSGGSGWGMSLIVIPQPRPAFTGVIFDTGSTLAVRSTVAGDAYSNSSWHHICLTYDGINAKFYVDGTQIGADIPCTVPTNDTSTQVQLLSGDLCPIDIAHAKAWIGRALSSSEIADEIASYAPVTDLANLRGYWPLAWDNPRWDARGSYTINSGILHAGDDAPNGPPGTWPPIGSVAGSTSTSGTASVQRVYALACTGSTSTSGTASTNSVRAVVSTGSTSSAGTAQLNRVYSFASTGGTQTAGAAAVSFTQLIAVSASGSAQTAGTAAVPATSTLAVSSSTQTAGAATVAANHTKTAAGASSTSGAAAVTSSANLTASASTSTGGAAAVGNLTSLAAVGSSSTAGAATATAAAALVATGAAQTTGFAATAGTLIGLGAAQTAGAASFATASFPVTVAGESSTAGAADVSSGFPQTASAVCSSNGTAALSANVAVVATGSSSTAGTSRFALHVSGSALTTGIANVTTAASFTAGGQGSTSGTAALGFGIYPSGSTQTLGAAAFTAAAGLSGAGMVSAFGSAVFDGIVPPSGGGGGEVDSRNRVGVAAGLGRRRVR